MIPRCLAVTAILACLTVVGGFTSEAQAADRKSCGNLTCLNADLNQGAVRLQAADVSGSDVRGVRRASTASPPIPLRQWRLQTPCEVTDATDGACVPSAMTCPVEPGRVIGLYVVQWQALAQPILNDPSEPAVGNAEPTVPLPPGTPFGNWINDGQACVDVTDLNPPPSPDT
jgi:hypothetical protein